ncbi:MAG: SpoIIE family protein phosphatase, partial [Candidatus Brocadiaceae bacterium]
MKTIEEIQDRGFGEILHCLNAGVYITDTDRRIVFWNRTAEEITGYSAAEVIGHRCSANILSHTDKDGRPLCTTDLCPLHRAMTLEAPGEEPIIVYATSKGGTRLPLSTSVAPVYSDDGEVIGGVEVFRDERQGVRELELARTVQRQMLTSDLPGDDRVSFAVQYAPKEMIGGDFYHFSQTSDETFQMFLGDAAGHGPSAALYTALIYGSLMECERLLGSPAALMEALNERACQRAGGLGFFTAVCVAVNAADGSAAYCSAGHPPLLLQRRETGRVERLHLAQLPVGV